MEGAEVLGDRGVLGARRLDFDRIPVIDVGPLLGSDEGQIATVAARIGEVCRSIGFFYVTNHGIPDDVIAAMIEQSKRFFDLPLAIKSKYDIDICQRHRGYVPVGGLAADPTAEADLQEGYEVSLELPESDPDYRAGNIMYGPNLWPTELPGFREEVYAYYEAVLALGRRVLGAFEIALGLPRGYFDDKTDKPMGQLRLIHYPPQQGPICERRVGIGAHSDYECFTLLLQTAAGLQVRNVQGDWVEAPPLPGTLVVNIGDMMMRWTNGQFVSTGHRVINTSGGSRYSFPFFFGANFETVVRPLPKFCGPDDPPRYPPTKCGYWTQRMITDAYAYRAAYRGKVPNPELAA
jgi:isopenicillin N synthase-like dioxygenase